MFTAIILPDEAALALKKLVDLAILDQDPADWPPEELKNLRKAIRAIKRAADDVRSPNRQEIYDDEDDDDAELPPPPVSPEPEPANAKRGGSSWRKLKKEALELARAAHSLLNVPNPITKPLGDSDEIHRDRDPGEGTSDTESELEDQTGMGDDGGCPSISSPVQERVDGGDSASDVVRSSDDSPEG